ncbi:gamma-glutamyltransferase [Terriglobus albidus]|uniref:gamma-glutamyltransferase n=1 Tax=Terriglobus albidus TaxID=1592106 RepID=UPI0021E054B7|nr:gamma-glutamyltransferase [Terriglobus albidus]
MSLHPLRSGILLLCLTSAMQAQFGSAPAGGTQTPDAAGGSIRDSRQHPAEPSRDNAFSMTINRYGIAATLQTLASQASATILARGGNAVDAAIAANAAVGVIEPMMNGIGGDLFAIVWDPKEKKMYALNASGWSAKDETIDAMKARGVTTMDGTSIYAVTVPGAVAGWAALHAKFGKLPLAVDLAPAIALAENGFPVTETDSATWAQYGMPFKDRAAFASIYLPKGTYPREGEIFRNPDLANSLRLIAKNGADAFYRGPIADAIVKLSDQNNGFLTKADFAEYKAEWVEPISTTYHGWRVYETPPNTQGVAALSMLNVMELYPLRDWGHDSAKTLHIEMEAKALAYADMLHYVGDPNTDDIPTKKLISKELAKERAQGITDKANCKVLPSDRKAQLDKLQSDTTYLATVDRDGMVVSFIQSDAGSFGSGLVAEHTGFVLHNRAGGFYMQPGQPNSLAGHKRPLHTIIPAMMQKDGKTIGFGIMSGFNQAQAHAQFVANVVDFGMNIQAAMDAARFNKGNSGCTVSIEDGYPHEVLEQLASQGHQIILVPRYSQVMGRGNAVMRDATRDVNFGATDPRADGQATPEQPPF